MAASWHGTRLVALSNDVSVKNKERAKNNDVTFQSSMTIFKPISITYIVISANTPS